MRETRYPSMLDALGNGLGYSLVLRHRGCAA